MIGPEQLFSDEKVQFLVLGLTFLFYVLTKEALFGFLLGGELIFFVLLEFKRGIEKHGLVKELIETTKTLALAFTLFLTLSFLLGSSVPVSAVVSCSMNPYFHRGDFVIVRGMNPKELVAPVVNASLSDFNSLNSVNTYVLFNGKKIMEVNGSIFSYCNFHQSSEICKMFFTTPEHFTDQRGNFFFNYGKCVREDEAKHIGREVPCVVSLRYKNKTFYFNKKNDVIVYSAYKGDLFSLVGDIIHRVFLKVRVNALNKTVFLTKGDNNNIFDIQMYDEKLKMGNRPVDNSRVKGVYWFAVPYLGYFKLALSGYVEEEDLCSTVLYNQKIGGG
jgi:signal peptidase I